MKILDITGRKFGMLTALRFSDRKNGSTYWIFLCDCGKEKRIISRNVITDNVKSCGCHKKEFLRNIATTHGMSKTHIYSVWRSMKSRCIKPSHISYINYGGRGIKVCDRWIKSFKNFFEDMGSTYRKGLEIERINNNGNYEPDNCKWATEKEQGNNKRSNVILNHNGRKMTIKQWSEFLNINEATLYRRYYQKWPVNRLLNPKSNRIMVTYNGEEINVSQLAKKLNVKATSIHSRLRYGWSLEKILSVPYKKK